MTCVRLDLEDHWPYLFEELTLAELEIVRETVVSALRDGWRIDREDLRDLVDEVRGVITSEEFLRRSYLKARAIASHGVHPQSRHQLAGSV